VNGTEATVTLTVPESYRNSFVQPLLTIYGPALQKVTNKSSDLGYAGLVQDSLAIVSEENGNMSVSGTFTTITVEGSGSVDLGSSSVQNLDVHSSQNLTVTAGTVRGLNVVQPDVCPSGAYGDNTSVTISGVTSDEMTYNGQTMPAKTHRTSCAAVIVQPNESDITY